MINRINLILRAKNVTARQFAEEIGIQPSGMSHIMGGRNNPSLEFVTKVLRRYPEIDANWLLLGKGEMYTSASPLPASSAVPSLEVEAQQQQSPDPTLFQTEEETPLKVAEPSYRPVYQEDEERTYEPSYIATPPTEDVAKEHRVERILLIYSDNTYRELLPR